MRSLFLILFLFGTLAGSAQWKIMGINEDTPNARKANSTDTIYTLLLPFWDDFSASGSTPDTLLWSDGADIFVNATMGINSPSYKVATFDGLTRTGAAHNLESDYTGRTDSLTSHYIDLSKVSDFNRNTVYLSFYWEAWGNGEMPDEEDALMLQLYAKTGWETVWIRHGGLSNPQNEFQQEVIQIKEEKFFHNKFRMKFVSTSNPKGPFDTWHLDYIYLNQNRYRSKSHYDRAITGTITPLFYPYQTISAEHFNLNLENTLKAQKVFFTNLDLTAKHPVDYTYKLENITSGELYQYSHIGIGQNTNIDTLEFREISGPEIQYLPDGIQKLDSQIISSVFFWTTGDKYLFEEADDKDTLFLPVNLKVNDTIRANYLIQDHYAYDDGTAEYAAAINLQTGMVAMKYKLPRKDTLTHIDIYFPNIAGDGSAKSISLMVWDQLTTTGVRLKQSYTVQCPSELNTFVRIKLSESVITRDSVYIGFQQNTNEYIGIGFDRNSPAGSDKIYTNISTNWEQNTRLSGSLMIRPVFGRDTTLLPLDTTILNSRVNELAIAYPNPTKGSIKIKGKHQSISIYTLTGHLIHTATADEEYDLSFLSDGIYLLRIINNETITTQKLIIHDE